jgi:kumamolisin
LYRSFRPAAAVVLAATFLLACVPAPATTHDLIAESPFRPLLLRSVDLGPASASEEVTVTLQLVDPAAAGRSAAAAAIYDPSSPAYQDYLDAGRQAALFGPDPAAARAVTEQLTAAGLSAGWNPGSEFVTGRGPAPLVARLFRLAIHDFRSRRGILFHAGLGAPAIPRGLTRLVQSVDYVSSYPRARTAFVPQGGLTPQVVGTAYDLDALRATGIDGSGETVVIWALGDGFDQKSLDTFSDRFQLPRVVPQVIFGPADAKPGSELMMDIEVVHAIAPGAAIHVVTDDGKNEAAVFDHMLADKAAVWSNSWGSCEQAGAGPVEPVAYTSAAAAGITALQSTGDSGAYRCLDVDWGAPPSEKYVGVEYPAALPFGVTAVGGTRLSVRSDGSYLDEVVWAQPLTTTGSGGGISAADAQPEWQRGPGVTDNPQNPKRHRMIPDVVADADPSSGMAVFIDGGWSQGGGTSQAAPMWAGFITLINAYLVKKGLKRVGFVNPALYDLAAGKPAFAPFHDVTVGNNLLYDAGPGFDIASGLGSPDVWNLARDLETYQRKGGKP